MEDETQKATPGAEVTVLVAAIAITGLFSYLGWLSYLRFLEWAGPENFDAASNAAGAYQTHDSFVGRIIEGWATARRRD